MLPRDVRVYAAEDAPQSFHATLDARAKLYRYVIDNATVADPFQVRHAWHVFPKLDAHAMHRAAQSLKGRHDFHSFETNWPNRTSSVRTITHIAVNRANEFVWIDVEADGFLYNMVRSITGTLVEVGKGKWAESKVAEVLATEDRREAGPTAPPQGLFLVRVRYRQEKLSCPSSRIASATTPSSLAPNEQGIGADPVMAYLPFRAELADLFESDRSDHVWKMIGGTCVAAFLAAIRWLR